MCPRDQLGWAQDPGVEGPGAQRDREALKPTQGQGEAARNCIGPRLALSCEALADRA